jgi:hypothetical protein
MPKRPAQPWWCWPTPAKRYDLLRRDDTETFKQAIKRRREAIIALMGHGPDHDILARRLKHCRKDKRCGSDACPVCMRQKRRRIVGEIARVLEGR